MIREDSSEDSQTRLLLAGCLTSIKIATVLPHGVLLSPEHDETFFSRFHDGVLRP